MNKQVQGRIEKYLIYTFSQRKKADQRSAFWCNSTKNVKIEFIFYAWCLLNLFSRILHKIRCRNSTQHQIALSTSGNNGLY